MKIYPIILCGGSGTRLWPASRPTRPKQFIPLMGETSLFQQTVARVRALPAFEKLIIVAGATHANWIGRQTELDDDVIVLLEPAGRDSAPAIAAATALILNEDPDGIGIVVASDHYIPDQKAFIDAVMIAAGHAQNQDDDGTIVTLGIVPKHPTSAYGYINPYDASSTPQEVRKVQNFVEKPDLETAARYIDDGYLWNSGNFIFSASRMNNELLHSNPAIIDQTRLAIDVAERRGAFIYLGEDFLTAPKISIDYAVMEKTDHAFVLPVSLEWSDLGAWDAVKEAVGADTNAKPDDNVVIAPTNDDIILHDSKNCLISTGGDSVVAVAGVDNIAVIVEEDAVLVCHLDHAQAVKSIAQTLADADKPQAQAPLAPNSKNSIAMWAQNYKEWLFASALPAWFALGADHQGWGFHESLETDHTPTGDNRRARVQARQAYSFALAGAAGWQGPWKTAAIRAWDGFATHYQRDDGLFRTLVSPEGNCLDDTARLYDQAFALMALSSLTSCLPDAEQQALTLLKAVKATMTHSQGGYRENSHRPFQANAHMHLLEAALAWMGISNSTHWQALADEIATLALTRLIDPHTGALAEFFCPDWTLKTEEKGPITEPGHQFEWSHLLCNWAIRTNHEQCLNAARKLYECGMRGVEPVKRAAINRMTLSGIPLVTTSRLWPQTEWLKAACTLYSQDDGQSRTRYENDIRTSAQTLWRYLADAPPGLWRDQLSDADIFEPGPVPASSLYHLATASLYLQKI